MNIQHTSRQPGASRRTTLVLTLSLTSLWGCLPDIVLAPQDASVDAGLDVPIDLGDAGLRADEAQVALDAAMDVHVPVDVMTDAGPCGVGQSLCGDACVDLGSNIDHCGRCDNFCPQPSSGMRVCREGLCGARCPPDTTQCDGRCVVLATERMHCGACGRACAAVQFCVDGGCSDTP